MLNIVVLSSLFPSSVQPNAGIFIRERMFRVAKHANLTVISPQPWFPGQFIVRWIRPKYRLAGKKYEEIEGVKIYRPRFLALPALGRRFDATMMAMRIMFFVRRLKSAAGCDLIDAHFGYPDGAAASLIGKYLKLPVTVTLRGTEPGHLKRHELRERLLTGLRDASRVICVSQSLKDLMVVNGIEQEKLEVVGNGVDNQKFVAMDKSSARRELGLPQDTKILITVGGLVERKGFHRVMEIMPSLIKEHPNLIYLIIGGASAEGDWFEHLSALAVELNLTRHVRFLGQVSSEQLRVPLSASDLFVLSSRNEGWANVILESMACGTPVIASDVGGNAEVVSNENLGSIVPFGSPVALERAIKTGLNRNWQRDTLIDHALSNDWSHRVKQLTALFTQVCRAKNTYAAEAQN